MVSKVRIIWKQTVSSASGGASPSSSHAVATRERLDDKLNALLSSPTSSSRTEAANDAVAKLLAQATGAWPYNRPCAHQYVGKSQSCMVISGRLIVRAPVQPAPGAFGQQLRTGPMPDANTLRVRFQIIGNACIKNVGKSQSCMVPQ